MLFMEKMHALSKTWVAKAILVALPISFVAGGMYGYIGTSHNASAITINGEEISQELFQRRYSQEFQRQGEAMGVARFSAMADNPEFIAAVRNKVMNDLVNEELLRQYTNELHLAVSDDAIRRTIVSQPELQVNGKFSNEAYQLMLRNNNMTADQYASLLREALRFSQIEQGVADSDFMTDSEQELLLKGLFQERHVRLAKLPLVAEIEKQNVSAQEIEEYYNTNKAAFKVPEMVKVQYLDLTKAAVEKSVNVTDVEIQQYYQDNKSEFSTKGQQHLAHIQLASEQDAQDVYNALQAGANFAELAKEKSVDKLSAKKGGDLGWMTTGDLPQHFEDAAALVEVGHYSAPINVDGQFHIVKVEDRKSPTLLPLAQVRDRIVDKLRQELVANKFYDVEKQIAEKAAENPDNLEAAAAVIGLPIQETDYFSRDNMPEALNFPAVAGAMFDGDISQGNINSEPMNVGDQHSVVVRVLDHQMEGVKSLDNAKEEITTLLKRQKAEKIILDNAAQFINALQQGSQPTEVRFGNDEKWVFLENKDPSLTQAIFAMPRPENGKSTYQAVKDGENEIFLVALDSIESGQPNKQVRALVAANIMREQQGQMQLHLLNALRAKAKIETNNNFMQQLEH